MAYVLSREALPSYLWVLQVFGLPYPPCTELGGGGDSFLLSSMAFTKPHPSAFPLLSGCFFPWRFPLSGGTPLWLEISKSLSPALKTVCVGAFSPLFDGCCFPGMSGLSSESLKWSSPPCTWIPPLLPAALSLKCNHFSCQSHSKFWTHLHHLFLPPVQLENTFCSFFLCSAGRIFCFFLAFISVSNLYRLSSRFLTSLPGPSLFWLPFPLLPHSFLPV